jgi:hypothetical protein
MKQWKTSAKRATLALFAAAVIVPAAQAIPPDDGYGPATQVSQEQPTRPDDRAGVHAVDGVVLGSTDRIFGIADASSTVVSDWRATSGDPAVSTDPSLIKRHEALGKLDMPAASYYTKQSVDAMGARYQAQAEALGLADVQTLSPQQVLDAVRLTSPGAVGLAEQYLLDSGQLASPLGTRPDDRAGLHGPGPITASAPSAEGGFSWSDASIGAVSAFGASLLLAGLMLLALHTNHRRRDRLASH